MRREIHLFQNHISLNTTTNHYVYNIVSQEKKKKKNIRKNGIFIAALNQRCILLFHHRGVMRYCMDTKSWSSLKKKIPFVIGRKSEATATIDDEYVIVIGGEYQENVFVYDIKHNVVHQTAIKVPSM